ncbi:hypothetical protein PIB30_027634 [Stylosanthes scabra]|uniref:Protein kinase domain-containing protein n=1 Tax=Stylosanthes scabra TaxID=79078 RepID=A0ABU6QAY4_9FABA|nr:hypothetical protein [Stylosanthes scabra]
MANWLGILIPFLSSFLFIISAERIFSNQCKVASCSMDGPSIRFPFRLKGTQPEWCSHDSWFDLSCTDTNNTMLHLPFPFKALLVKSINYTSQLITLSYPQACSIHTHIPHFDFSVSPFSFIDDSLLHNYAFFNCSRIDKDYFLTSGSFSCLDVPGFEVVAVNSNQLIVNTPLLSCTSIRSSVQLPSSLFDKNIDTVLKWFQPDCKDCEDHGGRCEVRGNESNHSLECIDLPHSTKGLSRGKKLAGEILGPIMFLFLGVAAYCIYVACNERLSYMKIKRLLEDYKALKPARYSYSDIRRITNQFKEELGQGAYGTVFKGKLWDEVEVAVKVLNAPSGNGQEFINEMEAMCRIHHVNVARLVGYCSDGSRRALVYEFLPNGSLQKFISSADTKDVFLGWEKLQDIALGIAKGIEYLHQGCEKRILHFDIKPHNVLLDSNFTPKISDFGLAKLCPIDQSIVSMTTARGTLGYIAPEVFSRNFGNLSCKSDVYSYGMLLLEMVGGRKITDVTEVNRSHVYYPQWIYNLLDNKEDIKIHVEGSEDTRVAKKLSIVGLWCIQWHPANRPTMKDVLQMLERHGEGLEMPPNPFASSTTIKTRAIFSNGSLNQELDVISEIE